MTGNLFDVFYKGMHLGVVDSESNVVEVAVNDYIHNPYAALKHLLEYAPDILTLRSKEDG